MREAGLKHVHTKGGTSHITPYSTRYASKQEISKFEIPQDGAPADAVHQMLKDELDLDGRPNLNLARYDAHFSTLPLVYCLLMVESTASLAPTWNPMPSN
jgi:glutamate/tyrosine decarboxylase-like PLP-dependent enzyme